MRLPDKKDDDVTVRTDALHIGTTERAVKASEEQGRQTEQQLQAAATQLENALQTGVHDPGIIQRVSAIIAYLRSTGDGVPSNPMIDLLREPEHPAPAKYHRGKTT